MLIPCIDLQGGQAVQLVHGKKRELAVPDVFKQLEAFKDYEWLHIIDLDAATGEGSNQELARELCKKARRSYKMRVRVGGGIRTVAHAQKIAAWKPEQIIVGSAAFKDGEINARFLRALDQQDRSEAHCDRAGHCALPHRDKRVAQEIATLRDRSDAATRTILLGFSVYGCGPRRNHVRRQPPMVSRITASHKTPHHRRRWNKNAT